MERARTRTLLAQIQKALEGVVTADMHATAEMFRLWHELASDADRRKVLAYARSIAGSAASKTPTPPT